MARGRARRGSRLLRAMRMTAERERYAQYVGGKIDRQRNVGTRGPRPASIDLLIKPFTYDLAPSQYIKVSALVPSWNLNQGLVGTRTQELATASSADAIEIRGFCEARVSVKRGINPNSREITASNSTGRKRINKGGTSSSIPFGRSTDTEDYSAAEQAIRTALGSADPTVYVSFLPEER